MTGFDYTPTYILTWNPARFHWEEYSNICRITQGRYTIYNMDWSCRSKKPKAEDRFILLLQGQGEKNGIVGHGTFVKPPYELGVNTPYGGRFVDISIKKLWDYQSDEYPRTADLKKIYPEQCWVPQFSGIRIKSSILPELWAYIKGF